MWEVLVDGLVWQGWVHDEDEEENRLIIDEFGGLWRPVAEGPHPHLPRIHPDETFRSYCVLCGKYPVAGWYIDIDKPTSLEMWKMTAVFNQCPTLGGWTTETLRHSILTDARDGLTRNPAKMVEEMRMHGGGWAIPDWDDIKDAASTWARRGWWDEQYKR